MDSKLLLLKSITLLFCESNCEKVSYRSDELAKRVISYLRIPDQVVENDLTRNAIVGLRNTLLWMLEQPTDEHFDYTSLLQRIRCYVGDESSVIQSFEDAHHYLTLNSDDLFEICRSLSSEIRHALSHWALKETIHKAHRQLFYSKKPIDINEYVESLLGELEHFNGETKDTDNRFVLDIANMSDIESLKQHLESAREDNQSGGRGFISGWRAVNRMLGDKAVFRRGDFVLVGGLTNCYKSGFVHDLFRHFCLYNDPIPSEEGKQPTLLYFIAENHMEDDLARMYIALKEHETGEPVDINAIDPEEAACYTSEKLRQRGWHVDMIRIDPSDFSYRDLFNVVLDYESKNYEIQAIIFDYLALISRAGLNKTGMTGEDVRELMQRVRTFMASRDILFITPHQLSQQANDLKRQGIANFVQEVAGKNYWDGSKRIVNEVDLEIIVDIVDVNNASYLSIGRGKHRTVRVTPRKHRFFYIPFSDVGFAQEDIHLPEEQERTVYDFASITGSGDLDWD